jgi:methylated-DNA-[protein]-cysteine S-methyltransferase
LEDAPDKAVDLAQRAAEKIKRYFDGEVISFDEPLDLADAPEFFARVWTELRKVPRGETISYGELARRSGNPRAARAVGTAMATNPVPIIVPCHRVIRSDGSIGGFGGGLAMKQRMLELEKN